MRFPRATRLPLYRQSQMLARHGVELDRSTLCDWVGRACWWLEPLHAAMLSAVLASPRVFADDTTLPVLDPGQGKTKTGRLWCYAADNRPWAGPGHPARRRRLPPRPSSRARPAHGGRRWRDPDHGIEVPAAPGADRKKWRKFSAHSGTEVAEREPLSANSLVVRQISTKHPPINASKASHTPNFAGSSQ